MLCWSIPGFLFTGSVGMFMVTIIIKRLLNTVYKAGVHSY